MNEQTLSSGYLRIELHAQCFAQLPPQFIGDTIPDEFIFQPEWNRGPINEYWSTRRPRP